MANSWDGDLGRELGQALGEEAASQGVNVLLGPGLDSARQILKAVEDGKLTMEEVDACVDDLLDAVLSLTGENASKLSEINWEQHHALARKAASESIVLLKNRTEPEPVLPW